MNKQGFIDAVAAKAGLTNKDGRKAVNAVIDVVTESLGNNDQVVFTGFGKFEARARKECSRINPQTGLRLNVPAKVVPAFKAGKNLRDVVSRKLKVIKVGSKLKVK